MSQNVHAVLQGRNATLSKLTSRNVDATKTFMALISNLITLCNKKGASIEQVRMGPILVDDRKLKSRVNFGVSASTERPWESRDTFYSYTKRKALRMAEAVEKNPSLVDFLGRLIGTLENYAASKAISFSGLKISHACIDRDNLLVMELNR